MLLSVASCDINMASRALAALRRTVRPTASFRLASLPVSRAYASAVTQDPMTGEFSSAPDIDVGRIGTAVNLGLTVKEG